MRSIKLLALCALVSACTVPDKFFTDAGGGDDEVDAQTDVTLTISLSGNSIGTVTSDPVGIDCGTACEITVPAGTTLTLTATPDADTEFTGWSGGECSGTGTCEITVNDDITVDAAFDLVKHTLTVSATGNGDGTITSDPDGIDCGGDCDEEYDHGTSVTLTASGDATSTFLGWTGGGCTGTGPCTLDVTADVSVSAAFGLNNSIVVTKDGTGEGTVVADMGALDCGLDCDEAYAPNTMVTLTATPIGDAVFTEWSAGPCMGLTGTCLVTVNAAILVTATFTQNQYPLTINRNGTGTGSVTSDVGDIDCPGTCTDNYDSGTTVVLTATPTTGKFAAWSGAGITCPGVDTCSVSMTAARTVTATFTLITVMDVTSSTTNGAYGTGSGISIQMTFTDPVVVTGTPTLTLNSGGTANYASGSGTNTLTFAYTVAAGQAASDLDYSSTSALALNGGTIRDGLGNNATLTLPAVGGFGSLGFNKNISVDAVAPTITNVTSSTANGAYNVPDVISVQVVFSEAVTVTGGPPTLALNTGVNATYSSGSGGTTLNFSYTVAAGQNVSDLDYVATTSLALGGGTIRDAVSNNAVLTLAAPGTAGSLGNNKAIVIDTVAPTVSNVTSSTANGAYTVGATINVQVVFSENVTVASGTPNIVLNTGANVDYTTGTGTTTLVFPYTVAAGQNVADLDQNGIGALNLGGGSIRDAAGNDATLALAAPGAPGSLGANKNLVIDTTVPTISSITSTTANGSYTTGGMIVITVTFSEIVNVTGTPQLTLNTGATVNYSSGSGTTVWSFTYTIAAGQNTGDLDVTAFGLNGGAVRDGALNNATLTLPGGVNSLAGSKALVVDTSTPTVTSLNSTTANGAYNAGNVISIQVNFSEAVTVTGTPRLALNSGATIDFSGGSGTSTLTFAYTIAAGQNSADLDVNATTSLTLNGGTIRDTQFDATLTLPAPGAPASLGANKAIVVDTAAPSVSSVTSTTANGAYGFGTLIPIQVVFSEPVVLTGGTPTLALNSASPSPTATYASGSGTNTLVFNYTIANGHHSGDLNYVAIGSLSLNGATIRDPATNTASVTLPAVAGANSLGGTKNLMVHTNAQSFASSQSFTVPAGVTQISVLLVGGGGGGPNGHNGGGGSGFVTRTSVTVTPSQVINVTIGAGGTGAIAQTNNTITGNSNGGTTSFGGLASAAGGFSVYNVNDDAGAGGSGGGGGCNAGAAGGVGGTNGGDGTDCSNAGGAGQGPFNLSGWVLNVTTAGAGGAGGTSSHAGGGGGGGVLLNTFGPTAGNGSQSFSGKGGVGYGAGGGAGGYDQSGTTRFAGGAGAPGLVYIEY